GLSISEQHGRSLQNSTTKDTKGHEGKPEQLIRRAGKQEREPRVNSALSFLFSFLPRSSWAFLRAPSCASWFLQILYHRDLPGLLGLEVPDADRDLDRGQAEPADGRGGRVVDAACVGLDRVAAGIEEVIVQVAEVGRALAQDLDLERQHVGRHEV